MAKGNYAVPVQKGFVPSDVSRNAILENVSIQAFQDMEGFISRKVAPTIGVADQAFRYMELDDGTVSQNKATARAPGTPSEEGSFNMVLKSGLTEQFSYKEKLPEELVTTVNGISNQPRLEATSAKSVAEVLAISDEVRWANAFWKTGVWGRDLVGNASGNGGTTGSPTYTFWNAVGSNPIGNILAERNAGLLSSRRSANTLVLGANVLPGLLTNAQIVARVLNGQRPGSAADVGEEDIARLLKVKNVWVSTAIMNTAKEGPAPTNQFILDPNSAWLGYVAEDPEVNQTSAMYRFTWEGLAGNKDGIRDFKWFDMNVHSTWIEGILDDTFKLISAKCGTFFSNIVG